MPRPEWLSSNLLTKTCTWQLQWPMPTIPVDHLKVQLRPLAKDELEVELAAWLELLKVKITEVGKTELKLKSLSSEAKRQPRHKWTSRRKTRTKN